MKADADAAAAVDRAAGRGRGSKLISVKRIMVLQNLHYTFSTCYNEVARYRYSNIMISPSPRFLIERGLRFISANLI